MPIAVKRKTIFEDWAWNIKYAITGTARAVGTAVYNTVRIKHKKKYPHCAKCEDCHGCTCSYCKRATKCYTYEKLEYYDKSYKVDFNGWFDAYVSKDYIDKTLKMTQEEYVQYIMGLADKEIAERKRRREEAKHKKPFRWSDMSFDDHKKNLAEWGMECYETEEEYKDRMRRMDEMDDEYNKMLDSQPAVKEALASISQMGKSLGAHMAYTVMEKTDGDRKDNILMERCIGYMCKEVA
jgi:hypothetical protein